MFATTSFSESQVIVLGTIVTAVVIYPLILLAIGVLGHLQNKAHGGA